MLENKRERLKTFLRKIDEKAIVRIKHFMKESNYPECGGGVGGGGGGLPTKVKRSKSSLGNGSFRRKAEPMKALSLEDALDPQREHRTLTRQQPVRSQTFDLDSKTFERTNGNGPQSSFVKHNKTFHKLFPDIPEGEDLIHAYICAWQKEVPYHGRLYITETHACFYSSVLLKETKAVISVSSIQKVKKQNMALLVPNALSIRTSEGDKYLFVSLRNRDACYQLLCSVSPRLEAGSTNSSLILSSAEHSEKSKLVNSSQSSLDDSFDRPDSAAPQPPAGALPDRNPESGAMSLPNGSLPSPKSRLTAHRDLSSSFSSSSSSELPMEEGGSWMCSVTRRARSLLYQREASTLNTLLVIYLILVMLLLLSSGYIGLRIVALEEQLNLLGALPEFSLNSGYQDT
ncbi:GRAM domain-containing protein 2A [Gadus macrocephalus]|uniref:GRAM domain-containing protein 2A n=1 Tax=Gadus macrocephalus TaxID=80720 RepID=UPI0028CB7B4D|nr:GRAM domain-containing protein 2A [Gadus macrocephalus]